MKIRLANFDSIIIREEEDERGMQNRDEDEGQVNFYSLSGIWMSGMTFLHFRIDEWTVNAFMQGLNSLDDDRKIMKSG